MNQICRHSVSRNRSKSICSKFDILSHTTHHSIMKKILLAVLCIVTINCIQAQDFFYNVWQDSINQSTEDIGTVIGEDTTNSESLMVKLLEIFGLDTFITGSDTGATNYITYIINIVLGLWAFIALAMIIYGFYLMFFSDQDEWFAKAKAILKGASIALFIIGLSWFIISFLFNVIGILN